MVRFKSNIVNTALIRINEAFKKRNVRLGSEYAGLDFWLSSISCHAPGAPIFVIGTHIDEVSKFTLNKDKLKARYGQIAGFYFVSNVNKSGIDELVKSLINVTLQEKYMGEEIPV